MTCRTPTRMKKTERKGREIIWTLNDQKLPKFDQTHPRSSIASKQKELQGTDTKTHYNQRTWQRILKAARDKWFITYKGSATWSDQKYNQIPHHKVWRPKEIRHVFKVLKAKTKLRVQHLENLSFKSKEEIKIFPDKQKLMEFITSRIADKKC